MTWHGIGIAALTIFFLLIGAFWMRGRPLGELIVAIALTLGAFGAARANGLPAWRDAPFGDAYDIAVLVWQVITFARGSSH